jgi:FkbM family methyltransferase
MPRKTGARRYFEFGKNILRYRTVSRHRISKLSEERYDESVARYLRDPPEFTYANKGFYIFLNPEDSKISASIAITGEYGILQEDEVTHSFDSLVARDSIVVDIGANIGWYTLLAAKKARKVYAYEPDPSSFTLLKKSVAKNKFNNVRVDASCISNRQGSVELFLSATRNKGTNSIIRKEGTRAISVPSTTLDAVFPKETIDVLKVDVEGAEPEVILGAQKMIQEGRIKHIIMEWNPEVWSDRQILEEFDAYCINRKIAFDFPDNASKKNVHLVPKNPDKSSSLFHRNRKSNKIATNLDGDAPRPPKSPQPAGPVT